MPQARRVPSTKRSNHGNFADALGILAAEQRGRNGRMLSRKHEVNEAVVRHLRGGLLEGGALLLGQRPAVLAALLGRRRRPRRPLRLLLAKSVF